MAERHPLAPGDGTWSTFGPLLYDNPDERGEPGTTFMELIENNGGLTTGGPGSKWYFQNSNEGEDYYKVPCALRRFVMTLLEVVPGTTCTYQLEMDPRVAESAIQISADDPRKLIEDLRRMIFDFVMPDVEPIVQHVESVPACVHLTFSVDPATQAGEFRKRAGPEWKEHKANAETPRRWSNPMKFVPGRLLVSGRSAEAAAAGGSAAGKTTTTTCGKKARKSTNSRRGPQLSEHNRNLRIICTYFGWDHETMVDALACPVANSRLGLKNQPNLIKDARNIVAHIKSL